jgi:hypothetical protein
MNSFRPYRFSPIATQGELLRVITHIHESCHRLSMSTFGKFLPVAGNVGVFCHYDDEYVALTRLRNELCQPTTDTDLKYFTLLTPIVVPKSGDIPAATYTHLYIRKPDPYRYQTGDVDFVLPQDKYHALKHEIEIGHALPGSRVFERSELDMIELYNPAIDALAYVSPDSINEKIGIMLSDRTKS